MKNNDEQQEKRGHKNEDLEDKNDAKAPNTYEIDINLALIPIVSPKSSRSSLDIDYNSFKGVEIRRTSNTMYNASNISQHLQHSNTKIPPFSVFSSHILRIESSFNGKLPTISTDRPYLRVPLLIAFAPFSSNIAVWFQLICAVSRPKTEPHHSFAVSVFTVAAFTVLSRFRSRGIIQRARILLPISDDWIEVCSSPHYDDTYMTCLLVRVYLCAYIDVYACVIEHVCRVCCICRVPESSRIGWCI
ncbi:hypothetical protein LXL04_007950 [Taraxacum kok-saghyz]